MGAAAPCRPLRRLLSAPTISGPSALAYSVTAIQIANDEAAILTRVIKPERDGLPASAARALLKLQFTQADRDRMHELAVKNQAGKLTPAQGGELEGCLRVGRLLDLLGAKARLALKKKHRHDARQSRKLISWSEPARAVYRRHAKARAIADHPRVVVSPAPPGRARGQVGIRPPPRQRALGLSPVRAFAAPRFKIGRSQAQACWRRDSDRITA
jgi:hypothetical protein